MSLISQETLLAILIGGPLFLGLLAWLVRHEQTRNVVVTTATLLTALAGILLGIQGLSTIKQGAITITGGPLLAHAAEILEYVMILVFAVIGYRQRIWPVFGLALAQAAMALWAHTGIHAASAAPAFLVDPLAITLVLIISLIGSAIVFYGIGYMHRHEHHAPSTAASTGRFFFVLTGFLGLMNGLVLTDNLKCLSIFWEGTTLCSFFLIGHDGTDEARRNARRALLINAFGGAALTLGSALMVHAGGDGSLQGLIKSAAVLPIALLLLATFTKSAQMPFQSWLLGAMVAPTPVSALLHSSTMVKAGSYLVLRLMPGFESSVLSPVVAFAGAFTFAATSALAISQSNAKKVLAYSTIANLGLIVACAGINTPLAYAAGLAILIYHAVSKALLFLCVGTIEQQIGSRNIDDMSGIMFKMPLTTTVASIGMISMFLPPFGLLIGKWMAIASSVHAPLVLLMLVIGSALTVFFWAKWIGRIITTSYHEEYKLEPLPTSMRSALVFLVGMVIVTGVGSISIYQQWLHPMALNYLASAKLQPESLGLLNSVNSFMQWSVLPMFAMIALVVLFSIVGFRKAQVRRPFLCGENVGDGRQGYDFKSLMDQPVTAQVTSYYMVEMFGEGVVTKWANLAALMILLTLFARIVLL